MNCLFSGCIRQMSRKLNCLQLQYIYMIFLLFCCLCTSRRLTLTGYLQTLKRSIWSYDQREGGDIIDLFLGIIKFLSATEFPPSFPLTIVRVYGNFVSLLFHICRDMEYLSVVSPNAGEQGPETLQIRTLSRSDGLFVAPFPLMSLPLLKCCPDEWSTESSNVSLMQLEFWFSFSKFSAGLQPESFSLTKILDLKNDFENTPLSKWHLFLACFEFPVHQIFFLLC